ncbi:MAG TPA: LysE family translocator [Victivallales bacterium]|nr:LysE family translocator [Victivallales bacterium]
MFGIENYSEFLAIGILLNLMPGIDTIYIMERSISQGKIAGYFSVFGIVTGVFLQILLTAFGLSIILKTHVTLFNIIKIAGAVYLVYLGIEYIVKKEDILDKGLPKLEKSKLLKIYFKSILVNLMNPKTVLFILAFLPQYVNSQNSDNPVPYLVLGLSWVATGSIWCLFLAYSAAQMSKILKRNMRVSNYMGSIAGLIFILLGIDVLFF